MTDQPTNGLVAAVLTPAQQEVVDFWQAPNVPTQWFIGVPDKNGRVEVLALGEGFIWSIRIDLDGSEDHSQATVGDFETGIDI